MIDFSGVKINKLIIHNVGNKLKEEGILLSNERVDISEVSLHNILGTYFFKNFKDNSLYHFNHNDNLKFNEIYQYAKDIFSNGNFEDNSRKIAEHLYNVSTHPNIKSGEVSIALLTGTILNQKTYEAIGIFKSESKSSFLKIVNQEEKITVDWDRGIDPNKLEKGCIIFNNEYDYGFNVLPIDTRSRMDTKYWIEDFLTIKKINNDFEKTKTIASACKKYVTEDVVTEKTEKITLLNKVVDYIDSKPTFDLEDFVSNVTQDTKKSKELKNFISEYAAKNKSGDMYNFSVDNSAVKNIKKSIRNFIKLDTNIEIKVNHSSTDNTQYLEKGYDEEKNMFFYKVYFNEER